MTEEKPDKAYNTLTVDLDPSTCRTRQLQKLSHAITALLLVGAGIVLGWLINLLSPKQAIEEPTDRKEIYRESEPKPPLYNLSHRK